LKRYDISDAAKDLIRACKFVGIGYHTSQLEVIIQNKDNYENTKKAQAKKKELEEYIYSLNNVIKILNSLPLTQTVTYQVTYNGSCNIK
jgi:hypothetical protein